MRVRPLICLSALVCGALIAAGPAEARGAGGGMSNNANPKSCQLFSVGTYDMKPDGNGHLLISMAINKQPVTMIVDTSGYMTSLAPRLVSASAMTITAVGVPLAYDDDGAEMENLVTPDTVGIGVFTLPNIDMAVQNKDPVDKHIDGTLAWDMLGLFDIDLDFTNKKLKLFGQVHCPGQVVYWKLGRYTKIPFRLDDQNHIRFDSTVDGETVDTEIDTGHPTTNMREDTAYRTFGIHDNDPRLVDTVQNNPDGSKTPVHAYRFKSLTVGNIDIENPMVNVVVDKAYKTYLRKETLFGDQFFSTSMRVPPLTIGLDALEAMFDHVYIAYKEHVLYATASSTADAKTAATTN